ncbi:class I SAM-dependent methyltransferase [Roseococcus sp. SYP-B2431]|uniref:class I SAM-dependent DNA methyltransferase n=1 Tax=Roseococcus sp. SYP-B2431 TaxID=2496640 RepID=UPI00103D0251|nr:class I SAM-dependent methyltransferase [Roseococcus sp. SYP-B2431]TCH97429.1 class I SAM-dependent methyltransferase [Roseococcus sp. SYP-B2431]
MHPDAASIIGLYERHAAAFDRRRGKNLFERAWLDRFAALIPPGGEVLDLGCGSGEPIARHLEQSGLRVTGVDSSPSMIELCRTRFPGRDWHVADMRGLALGRRFDGILAWDSFFHLDQEDQRRIFPRFRDHAAAGAALMYTSGPAHGVALGRFEGETLFHASLDPVEYQALLDQNGFRVVAHRAEDPGCNGHTVWLAQRVDQAAASGGGSA